ncbi:MAG: NADH:flavin oxidoreductase [Desulfurivibrionaceae bacterium]|nr:NADH:flavin oxidoreductase [Desulfurivibrionaceae bacterium]
MRKIFEESTINRMTLKNRLIRSATWEGMCEEAGRPTARLIDCYRDLARGGVGLIITGYAFVSEEGRQLPCTLGAHSGQFVNDLKRLTGAVHAEEGKICLQLVHVGGQTKAKDIGRAPLAPSAVMTKQFPQVPVEMSFAEIQRVIKAFGEAAGRARESGFDAVQLHGAHGYLINQFLSPLTNLRTDEYGGSIDNRCRFMIEVYWRVREVVGRDYPVLIKLNGADHLVGGLDLEDAVYAAELLDQEGIDAIEISGGTPASGAMAPIRNKIDSPTLEGYNLPLCREIKAAVSCPVIAVGGFRSFPVVERAIRDEVDYVAMARPFIREPDLAARWRSGNRTAAFCISCSKCFMPGLKEGGIYCVVK